MEFSQIVVDLHFRSNSVSSTTLSKQQAVWNYQQRFVCVVYAACFIVIHTVCSPSPLHKTAEFYRIESTVVKSVDYYRKCFPLINFKTGLIPEFKLLIQPSRHSSLPLRPNCSCRPNSLPLPPSFIRGPTPCWGSLISRAVRGRNMSSSRQTATGELPVKHNSVCVCVQRPVEIWIAFPRIIE